MNHTNDKIVRRGEESSFLLEQHEINENDESEVSNKMCRCSHSSTFFVSLFETNLDECQYKDFGDEKESEKCHCQTLD